MIVDYASRVKYILATEGLLALIRHTFNHCFNYILSFDVYGIKVHYPQVACRLDASRFLPRVIDYDFYVVKDNTEADSLESKGYEFRSRVFKSREALKHGGIAMLVFVGGEIASITWIARNARLQRIFDDPPRRIDYSSGETLICGAATFPRYRRKGLYTYTLFKTLEYLASTGNQKSLSFTARALPIYGISERLFGSKFSGYEYRLRILGLQFLWERPAANK